MVDRKYPTFQFLFFAVITSLLLSACGDSTPPVVEKNEAKEIQKEERDLAADSIAIAKAVERDIGVYKRLTTESCEGFLSEFGNQQEGSIVRIETNWGVIRVRLFDDTPIHRANFLYLIERGYYAPTQITRIVPEFVIQGGNSEEMEDQEERFLIGKYTLPREVKRNHLHTRGALAMSRSYEGNPEKRSSAYDFYIVQGKKISNQTLYQAQKDNGYEYTDDERSRYNSRGGAPHLDGEHTVFGEVIEGLSVVDKIAALDTDDGEWPREEVILTMKVEE